MTLPVALDNHELVCTMRILVAIANYGLGHAEYLNKLLSEYKAMPCETEIVILSDIPKNLGAEVKVVVGLPTKDPWSLPFGHQRIFAERVEDFDLFIYSEDDMLITWRNIEAFLEMTRVLPGRDIAGFLRCELDSKGRRSYPDFNGPFRWIPSTVQRVGKYAFAIFSNLHSACYVLTRDQLKRAIASGGYLVAPHQGRYDLLCSAATDPYTQCGFSKVICISHISDVLVHHLPNRYSNSNTFGIGDDEFEKQVEFLLSLQDGAVCGHELFPTEKNIDHIRWDKMYYSAPDWDLLSLVPQNAKNVLTIGCGDGSTEAVLVQKGLEVSTIPLDPIMGMMAASKGITATQPDFEEAFQQLKGARFDCIIFSDVLQHLKDPDDVLSRTVKVLANGGEILISIPNFYCLKFLKDHFPYPVFKKWSYSNNLLHVIRRRHLRTWLRSSGITMSKFQYSAERQILKGLLLPAGIFNALLSERLVVVGKI